MTGRVRISVQDHVADVCLNRPEKLNALDPAMFTAIVEAMTRLDADTAVRAVVLSGEGRAFSAGLDLASMAAGGAGFPLDHRTFGIANTVQQAAWGWRALRVPVIAAVHGVAFGAGLQIMAGADIRIGHPSTRLSIREIHWGLVPDMGGTALWRTQVRDDVLRELTYSAREFDGAEAHRHGFLTRLSEIPKEAAFEIARTIATQSPDAVAAAKRLYTLAADADAATLLEAESAEQKRLKGSPNQIEAVASRREGRPPRFRD